MISCELLVQLSWILCILVPTWVAGDPRDVVISILAPRNPSSRYFSIQKISPAVYLGIEDVRQKGILKGKNINFTVKAEDTDCDQFEASIKAFDLAKHNHHAHVFFGPVCDSSLRNVAKFSQLAKWNIPVLSPGGFSHEFYRKEPHMLDVYENEYLYDEAYGDYDTDFASYITHVSEIPNEYPTMTRLGANFDQVTRFIEKLFRSFHWNRLSILYSQYMSDNVTIFQNYCFNAGRAIEDWAIRRVKMHNRHFIQGKEFDGNLLQTALGRKFSSKWSLIPVILALCRLREMNPKSFII